VRALARLGFLSLAVISLACRDGRVFGTEAELRLFPPSLAFPTTFVGGETTLELTASNAGRSRLEVALAVPEPFFLDQTQLELGGGEARNVVVRFRPPSAGSFAGTLSEVLLVGEGAEPLQCPAPSDCRAVHFEPDTGACVEEVLADGTACGAANACLVAGSCVAGVCLGAVKSCDDGNACTADSCSPEVGCLHRDASAECPAPSAACEVATCDAQLGCGVGLAADGTSCGAADCRTAQVCIAGACETRAVPEGARCGTATACRAQGTCRDNTCELPPTTTAVPLWTYAPGPARGALFKGHVDLQGNAYFLEPTIVPTDAGDSDWTAIELVSVDRDGQVRFRELISSGCRYGCGWSLHLALDTDGQRLFLVLPGSRLQARGLADGKLIWEQDTRANLPVRNPGTAGAGVFSTQAPFLLGSGDKVAVVVSEGSTDHWVHVVQYDRATGQPLPRVEKKGHAYGTASWGAGEFAISTANCWAPAGEVARFGSTGAQTAAQWVTGFLKGATSGGAWIQGYQGSSIVPPSGAAIAVPSLPTTQSFALEPIISGTRLISATTGSPDAWLREYDLTNGLLRWDAVASQSTPRYSSVPELALMDDGSVFTSGSTATGGAFAVFGAQGAELLRCGLPKSPDSPPAVRRGRYVVQQGDTLSSFDVGTLETARQGWVGAQGGPARDGYAR
jgi:hypothetical protein